MLSRNFTIGHLLNPNFDLQNLSLETNIHDVFGFRLSPKIAELLVPEEKLLDDNYTDNDLSIERLFAVRPDKMLHWRNENYPDGFANLEIDFIGFVLQCVGYFCDETPKSNNFFAKQFRQRYGR